jgi:hypothetical protein
MALKAANQIKTVIGAADLSLKADPGEAFLIKRIMVDAASATFITLKIEKTTVGYFKVSATYGNHLAFPKGLDTAIAVTTLLTENLLALLLKKEIFKGYPVAEGETFILTGAAAATDIKTVVYDIMEPADIKSDQPNGSRANEYLLINYGNTGAAIDAAGDAMYDNPLNPVEFPSFPYGEDVPAKHQITLHGIAGAEAGVRNATPATAIYTQNLKLIKDRAVLFDEDRNGIPFDFSQVSGAAGTKRAGGRSLIGDFSTTDPRQPMFFDAPMLFDQGDELNVYVTTVEPVDGSTIATDYQTLALIQTVKRIAAA